MNKDSDSNVILMMDINIAAMQLAFCEKAKGEKVDCVNAMQIAFGQKAKGEMMGTNVLSSHCSFSLAFI